MAVREISAHNTQVTLVATQPDMLGTVSLNWACQGDNKNSVTPL